MGAIWWCSVKIGSWVSLVVLLTASTAFAEDLAGKITASVGAVEGGAQGTLSEGEHVSLGDDGGCSILVDEDSLVEVCGDTSLVLRKEKKRRIVVLDRGEIRLTVEPRQFDQRIEIHTPAAVATLLGTIVHVSVDSAGVTTISSAEGQISVRSSNPEARGTTVIEPSEQVTVVPGQAPPERAVRLPTVEIAALGGCLVDFHSAAIGRDVAAHASEVMARLAVIDAADYDDRRSSNERPSTGIRAARQSLVVHDPIASQEDICTATECASGSMEALEQNENEQPMYSGKGFQ